MRGISATARRRRWKSTRRRASLLAIGDPLPAGRGSDGRAPVDEALKLIEGLIASGRASDEAKLLLTDCLFTFHYWDESGTATDWTNKD